MGIGKFCGRWGAKMCVSMISEKAAETIDPHRTASRPARPCSTFEATSALPLLPIFKTSAHATPSGYGKSEFVTNARRNVIEHITPRIPPTAQIQNGVQNGKSVQ